MKGYQLTFNNADCFPFVPDGLEVLVELDECPQFYFDQILKSVFNKLESFGINFVALNMEKGSHAHIHAYVQLAYKPGTMAAWHKMFPGVHVEECRGTPTQNMDYLSKTGKWENDVKHGTLKWGPFEYGEMLGGDQGSMREYVEFADKGQTYVQVIRAYPDALRYAWGIKHYITERGTNDGRQQDGGPRVQNPGKPGEYGEWPPTAGTD